MSWQDTIDSVLDDADVLRALRRRAEETAEWLEHKRWHEEDPEHRGQARLVTSWDGDAVESSLERPLAAPSTDATDDAPVRKRPQTLWAGCTCKNPAVHLVFGEDGGITNDLPTVIETNAYGVTETDAAVSYLGSNPAGTVEYRPGTGTPTPSYGGPGPLYK